MVFNNTNWNLYKVFTVAFEEQNLHRAAEIMLVSRTAIGQNIRELERQLGVTLFTPHHRGVIPTPQAVNLYSQIKSASNIIVGAENDLQTFTSESAGIIKISVPDAAVDTFIADYVKEFRVKYPKVQLEFFRRKGVDLLTTGNLDFVFDVDYKFADANLTTIKMFTLTDTFVVHKDFLKNHSLGQILSKEQFINLPIVSYHSTWSDFTREIKSETEPFVIRADSSSIVTLLVKKQVGIGWLCKEQLEAMNDPDVVEVQVEGFSFSSFPAVHIYCGYKNLSRPARAFLDGLIKFNKR